MKAISRQLNRRSKSKLLFPINESNFVSVYRPENFHFDKTQFIQDFETQSENSNSWMRQYFRPDGFGKTTLLSTLQAYYDCHQLLEEQEVLKKTKIAATQTRMERECFVIRFDFGTLRDNDEHLELVSDFHEVVNECIITHHHRYHHQFDRQTQKGQKYCKTNPENSLDSLKWMLQCIDLSRHPLYVLLDDHQFIIDRSLSFLEQYVPEDPSQIEEARNAWKEIEEVVVEMTRIYTEFLNIIGNFVVKNGGRVFVVGTCPLELHPTVDFRQMSHDTEFSTLCGVTEVELKHAIKQLGVSDEVKRNTLDKLISKLKGYRFGNCDEMDYVMNTQQVMHALHVVNQSAFLPSDRYLFDQRLIVKQDQSWRILLKSPMFIDVVLDALTMGEHGVECKEEIFASLNPSKVVSRIFHCKSTVISLLYYNGILTKVKSNSGRLRIKIANSLHQKAMIDSLRISLEICNDNIPSLTKAAQDVIIDGDLTLLENLFDDTIKSEYCISAGGESMKSSKRKVAMFLGLYFTGWKVEGIQHVEDVLNTMNATQFYVPERKVLIEMFHVPLSDIQVAFSHEGANHCDIKSLVEENFEKEDWGTADPKFRNLNVKDNCVSIPKMWKEYLLLARHNGDVIEKETLKPTTVIVIFSLGDHMIWKKLESGMET